MRPARPLAALACAALLAACADGPRVRRPDVFLIALDAASASYFGPYGDPTGTSPNLELLARESVLFENAYSQTATTVSSVASLLTGVRATTHLMTGRSTLPRSLPTAAEILSSHGYRAFGFIGNPFAGAPALGLDRGYERDVQVYALEALQGVRAREKSNHFTVALPEDVNAEVFRMLPELRSSAAFAYIHYLQPHKPYDPPERLRRIFDSGDKRSWDALHDAFERANESGEADPETVRALQARYRANIRYVDEGVGALLRRLRQEGLYAESLIVLTADHGDAFFEHGLFGHNKTLYDDMTRVPLLMRFPEREGVPPRRIDVPVEAIDVLPTLLDYLGIPRPPHLEGESLWPLVRGDVRELEEPEVVMATVQRSQHAIRLGDHKYVYVRSGPREELYDLAEDPHEQRNLVAEQRDRAEALRERLAARVDLDSEAALDADAALRSDPRMRELLESLGYVEEEIPDEPPPP